jgi:4-aminobutyrate aminotransferase-like enzyme/Ser/Thr protein kinase RdoA (MazF antagonist)
MFNEDDVKHLVKELYGLHVSVCPLESYIDHNFLVIDEKGNRYVFKIAHAGDDREILDAQDSAMTYLATNNTEIKCPQVCSSLVGEQINPVQSKEGTTHLARMLTYLPGTFYSQLTAHRPELLENMGRFLGSLDKTLAAFHHPALYHRYLRWDLKNTADLEIHADKIEDLYVRNLVKYFLLQFKTFVIPAFPKLRTSIIYNDANDNNILVSDDNKNIAGIIDFGDILYTHTIYEVAIAIAYAIYYSDDYLETAAHILTGYHTIYPLTELELEVLFHLICARQCQTLLIAACQLQKDPWNEYIKVSVAPAREALEKLLKINPQQAYQRFQRACGLPVKTMGLSPEEIVKIRHQHLGKSLSISYKKPLKIVRGAMQYLYGHDGSAYLDTVNNVCHVGHCHPRVVKAAQEQIAVLNTNTRYLHDNIVEYAQRLTATLPEPLKVCFFVCTGSEANELALRMARTHTRGADFVVLDHAYHGNTNTIIEISPYKFDGPGGAGCPAHVHKALLPDVFRGLYKANDRDTGQKYAEDVHRAFKEVESLGKKPAAFIHESLPSVAGQIVLPEHYLKNAYRFAREAGAVCIADEVQVGFGRVGTHMWGFETQGVVPDIVTMGKPIGNGHPLAAVITTQEIADSFHNGMEYFNTYGGNPVSCAIGLAVLDVIQDEQLQQNALKVGDYFKAGLCRLLEKHPLIGDVRGSGLFLGIELVLDRKTLEPAVDPAYYIAERFKEEGILVSVDGPLYNVLKIKPPLVFTQANADFYVNTLDKILSERAGQPPGPVRSI